MPSFAYTAIAPNGKQLRGQLDAADSSAAVKQLRSQQGLHVTNIKEGKQGVANKQLSIPFIGGKGGRVAPKDITLFSRQFATMVGAGLTILRCLIILEEQVTSASLKRILGEVCSDIESGRALSDALEKHPRAFDNLYVSMVRAGEIGGVLEMTLQRVATSMEQREALKRKVKSAMTYPTVVLIFAMMAAIGMIMFLVPIFANMYKGLGSALPGMTQLLVNLSADHKDQVIMIATPFVLFFLFSTWKRQEWGRRQWDRIKLRMPMRIGVIVRKLALARFARTLAELMASGVPVMQAVKITGDSSGSSVIEDAMDDIISSIEGGKPFSEPLRRHPIFPVMVIQMVTIGEETGKLDAMLMKVAEFYEDEVDALIKALTSIIEPLMMIFVGGIVGFIIIALYLPMFDLFQKIH